MYESLISPIKKNSYDLSAWFDKHFKRVPIPMMTAIAIKDGGFKAAPSDIQIFPAGINNLCKADLRAAPKLFKKYFKQHYADSPRLKKIVVLTTASHINPFYYEHLYTLMRLMKKAGFQVEAATIEPLDKKIIIKTPSQKSMAIHPARVEQARLRTEKMNPDLIYVSYPFSPELARQLTQVQQPLNPPCKVLSHKDKKSDYFSIFNRLATDFAQIANVDPWFLKTEFQVEHHVNFDERSGVEKVSHGTEALLGILELKYKQYGLTHKPTIKITNNRGTYGMGIISVASSQELAKLYRHKKKKKVSSKGQAIINDVLIQEAIPASPLYKRFFGETIIYLIGREIAGGYIRTYTDDAAQNLLKARQQLFVPICVTGKTHRHPKKRSDKNLNILYSHLSRVGGLAAGYEIDRIPS